MILFVDGTASLTPTRFTSGVAGHLPPKVCASQRGQAPLLFRQKPDFVTAPANMFTVCAHLYLFGL